MKFQVLILLFVIVTVFTINPSYSETENFEDEMDCIFEEDIDIFALEGFSHALLLGIEHIVIFNLFFPSWNKNNFVHRGDIIESPRLFKKRFNELVEKVRIKDDNYYRYLNREIALNKSKAIIDFVKKQQYLLKFRSVPEARELVKEKEVVRVLENKFLSDFKRNKKLLDLANSELNEALKVLKDYEKGVKKSKKVLNRALISYLIADSIIRFLALSIYQKNPGYFPFLKFGYHFAMKPFEDN